MDSNYRDLNAAQTGSESDPFSIERYQQFYRYLKSGTSIVLDVGCNIGRGGKELKTLNSSLKLTGLDCVQERLDSIPTGIYEKKICSLTTNIDTCNNYFEAIVAGEFIEHVLPDEVQQTLSEFYRVLKPGGALLLTTPNPRYFKLKLTGQSVLGGAHLSEHYPEELTAKLAHLGFHSIYIKGSGRVSRYLGENIPLLSLYGSYLVIATK